MMMACCLQKINDVVHRYICWWYVGLIKSLAEFVVKKLSTNGRAVTLSVRVKGLADVGCHGTCEALKAR